jgi:hypothetical protein
MKIDIDSTLTIILALIALVVSIYRLAQVEANINSRISHVESSILAIIDSTQDNLSERIIVLERKVDVHLAKYDGDKKYIYLYRLNANNKLVVNKFNRLANWITQIAGFLHKHSGFQIRDDKF